MKNLLNNFKNGKALLKLDWNENPNDLIVALNALNYKNSILTFNDLTDIYDSKLYISVVDKKNLLIKNDIDEISIFDTDEPHLYYFKMEDLIKELLLDQTQDDLINILLPKSDQNKKDLILTGALIIKFNNEEQFINIIETLNKWNCDYNLPTDLKMYNSYIVFNPIKNKFTFAPSFHDNIINSDDLLKYA